VLQSVSARADGGSGTTAATINILRNANSVFNDSTTVNATGFCNIATGTPVTSNTRSSAVTPHANHVTWTKGDRIRIYQTSGQTGSSTQSRNFHAAKVYIRGYRR
jgi:Tfp pilus assembly protein PilX